MNYKTYMKVNGTPVKSIKWLKDVLPVIHIFEVWVPFVGRYEKYTFSCCKTDIKNDYDTWFSFGVKFDIASIIDTIHTDIDWESDIDIDIHFFGMDDKYAQIDCANHVKKKG